MRHDALTHVIHTGTQLGLIGRLSEFSNKPIGESGRLLSETPACAELTVLIEGVHNKDYASMDGGYALIT